MGLLGAGTILDDSATRLYNSCSSEDEPEMFTAAAAEAEEDGKEAAPLVQPLQPALQQAQPLDADRDGWAAVLYSRLLSSPLLCPTLDSRLPTVPVILHPSAPRGAAPPPVTARHLGFLRVDLTGASTGPGRFFPLFPEDAAEEEAGVDSGSLDRFGCTGHWASSGCIRLLTASTPASLPGSSDSNGGSGGGGGSSGGALALMPPDDFAALWEHSSSGGGGAAVQGGWHMPYSRLLPLEEAYGGLYRELKAAGHDLSRAHYMLRGWKTREGRPRLGSSAPRSSAGGDGRPRRGVVPAEIAATRELRALIHWPGLLEMLEEEGVESVPTDAVRYWCARLGAGFQARLAAAGVLSPATTVHHIIARNSRGIDHPLSFFLPPLPPSRGIDHPLNFFLLDRGDNSALGSRVEGFRDAEGSRLHMRDIVGEQAFEVAQAACNLYHGVLYAGRRRGAALPDTLRELREGAFALAQEAMAARQAQQARRGSMGAAGGAEQAAGSAEEAAQAGQQPPQQPPPLQQAGHLRSGQKRERCSGQQLPHHQQQQQQQERGLGDENSPFNAFALSPTQREQERRRRLSGQAVLAPAAISQAPAVELAAAAGAPAQGGAAQEQDEEEVGAGLASMSLCCSPAAIPLATAEALEQRQQEQQSGPALGLSSLRARLQAALGAAPGGGE